MRHGETTLRWALEPLAAVLAHPATTEVVVRDPGKFGVEQDGFWSWHTAADLDLDRLEAIAFTAAYAAGKDIGSALPACTSTLPDGQRIKMMVPPAVAVGTVGFTIRRRALSFVPTLDWLQEQDYFESLNPAVDWPAWFGREVIGARRSIVICGEIGSSKTSFAEALLRAIPLTQRVVTVESSAEWMLLPQPGWQPLYFDEADPNAATNRVQDAMQSRPDWVPFGEIRGGGGDAWAILRAGKMGTPIITTVHAPCAAKAHSAMESMIVQSPAGGNMAVSEIRADLRTCFCVIAHCRRFLPTAPGERTRYRLTEVLEIGETEADDRLVSA